MAAVEGKKEKRRKAGLESTKGACSGLYRSTIKWSPNQIL